MSVAVCSDYTEKQTAGDDLSGIVGNSRDLFIQKQLHIAVGTDFFAAHCIEMTGKSLHEFSDLHKKASSSGNNLVNVQAS